MIFGHTRSWQQPAQSFHVALWLMMFSFYEWFRLKGVARLELPISALEVIEIGCVAYLMLMAREKQVASRATCLTALAGLLLVGLLAARPLLAASIISVAGLVAFFENVFLRRAFAALSLFLAQYSPLPFLLSILDASAKLDASVVREGLALLGYYVGGHGNVVGVASTGWSIDVTSSCATLAALMVTLPACGILLLAAAPLSKRHAAFGLALVVLSTFAVNLARLGAMAQSIEGYEFWHDGAGVSYLSALYTALVLAIAWPAVGKTSRNARL